MAQFLNTKNEIKEQGGSILILTLVFSAVFVMLFSGLVGFIYMQHKHSLEKASWYEALNVAEAGLNYYRWHLSHNPDDLKDGTGGAGPYEHIYSDLESGAIGRFSLEISGDNSCGLTSGITITSTGWTDKFPEVKRKTRAKYVRSTVADYSFIINDNVWVGADHKITGPYHSNGGIRMDGENNSIVSSAKETWLCTSSFGCNPSSEKPGIFGSGPNSNLWRFPVPVLDFNGITMDLARIKSSAQSGQGLYFGSSGASGYHVNLKQDRTVDVYKINSLNRINAYSVEEGWHDEYSIIGSESFLGNYSIPQDCGVIFIEDNLWVSDLTQGSKVKGKITLVSADLINFGRDTNIWLGGNIEYTIKDGSDGLVLIAENNNLIVPNSPNDLFLDGVYVAQKGKFGRNHYTGQAMKKNKLTIFGSVVSNGRVGTKWTCNGLFCSGYKDRETNYDSKLSSNPPPFLLPTSEEYEFKEWEEVE
ncbi:MAG: hypothetical protein AAB397_00440 [Patescibacteria group bacterium]